jgi:hypothetical protein
MNGEYTTLSKIAKITSDCALMICSPTMICVAPSVLAVIQGRPLGALLSEAPFSFGLGGSGMSGDGDGMSGAILISPRKLRSIEPPTAWRLTVSFQ